MLRRCLVCGADISRLRRDARCCSTACRTDLSRVIRLATGEPVDHYHSLYAWVEARASAVRTWSDSERERLARGLGVARRPRVAERRAS